MNLGQIWGEQLVFWWLGAAWARPRQSPSHAQPCPNKVLPLYMLDVPFPIL